MEENGTKKPEMLDLVKAKAIMCGDLIGLGLATDICMSRLMMEDPEQSIVVRDLSMMINAAIKEVGDLLSKSASQ